MLLKVSAILALISSLMNIVEVTGEDYKVTDSESYPVTGSVRGYVYIAAG